MIFALLTLTLGTLQVPKNVTVPVAIQHAVVPASIQISETHFLAQSYTPDAQWIVFENVQNGMRMLRGLGPFERLLYPIATGGAEGMTVEILGMEGSKISSASGAFPCESLKGQTVFIERRDTRSIAWIPRHAGRSLTRCEPTKGSVLNAHSKASSATGLSSAAAHVPVPLPSENKIKNKSRRIEKKKLPPL